MGISNEQYIGLIRYADGEMDEKEKAFFELLLARDATLADELKAYREIQALCNSAGKKMQDRITEEAEKKNADPAVMAMIEKARAQWEAEHEGKVSAFNSDGSKAGRVVFWKRKGLLAAAVVFGVLCFGLIWYQQKKPASVTTAANNRRAAAPPTSPETTGVANKQRSSDSNRIEQKTAGKQNSVAPINTDRLFAAHFTPDAVPSNKDSTLSEPFAYYEAKKYGAASAEFEQNEAVLQVRGSNETGGNFAFQTRYYLAMSYLAAGTKTKQAVIQLQAALNETGNGTVKEKVRWYLALAHLKAGNLPEAEKALQRLANLKGSYREKSLNLLKALNGNGPQQ